MDMKGWAVSMGLGAAMGAVAVLMMPRSNPTRKLAAKAANKVEDVGWNSSRSIPTSRPSTTPKPPTRSASATS